MMLCLFSKKLEIGRQEKLVCKLNDKEKNILYILNLHQRLNHGLKFREVCRVVRWKQ